VALATVCERLLDELENDDVSRAEIRFSVHKGERPVRPTPDPAATTDSELLWELRRLLAWSGGTLADVAQTLEANAANLDDKGRALLQQEADAVELDLAAVKGLLLDPVDWDQAHRRLIAGEIPPLEDDVGLDDEDADD
jgi:hypothetical protein